MKIPFVKSLLIAGLTASASAQLPSDQHWFYDHPQIGVEPFAFHSTDTHLYAGGLFLRADGVTNANNLLRFSFASKSWEQVPGLTEGLNGRVDTIVDGGDGYLYFGGNFGEAANTTSKRIARFKTSNGTWEALSGSGLAEAGWANGPADGRVLAIARIDNFVYVGGNFTLASIPTNERYMLRYNLTTNTWGPVGDGTGGIVDNLVVLPNGDLIAATRNDAGLMLWNGSAWSTYAGGVGGDGVIRTMALHPDGRLFVGGSLRKVGSPELDVNFVAAYNPTSGTWNSLNDGFGDEYLQQNGTNFTADGVYDLKISPSGDVYAGGDFQSDAAGTTQLLNHATLWDDTGEWKNIGSGVGSTGSQIVNCLAIGPDEELFVGGTFSRGWLPNRSASTQFAVWNPKKILTPIPISENQPIITNEDGTLYLHIRSVSGNQYKIQDHSNLNFPPLADQFGRFGAGNIGVLKRELGPAPVSGSKFYRLFVF